MADKAFLAEAQKAGLEIHEMNGEETAKRYRAFYDIPQATVDRAKAIIGRAAG